MERHNVMVISMNMARQLSIKWWWISFWKFGLEMVENPTSKSHLKQHPLKGFKGFKTDPTTGFPINPITGCLIDGTMSYYKSCLKFSHIWKSFTGCGSHKNVLAHLENEKGE